MFNPLGGLGDMMKNVGKIRETMEKAGEALNKLQVDGIAGGGAVTAKVNGKMELLSIRIDPKLLSDGDAEMLEELIAAAVNQALTKARDAAAQSFSSLAGGFSIPGMSGMFGPGPGAP